MSKLSDEDHQEYGPPSTISVHEGASFTFHLPGADGFSDDEEVAESITQAYADVQDSLRKIADQHGGRTWREIHGPMTGSHENVVLWVLGVLASGLAWDLFKAAGFKLHGVLREARDRNLGVEADVDCIVFAAWEEVRLKSNEFRTDWELTQVMVDGHARALEDGYIPFTGFPTGTHLVRVPNLATRATHIIEIRSNGEVLSHVVRPQLTQDAEEYLVREQMLKAPG